MRFIGKRIVFAVGIISTGLGIIGIFVPLLPTTPFLLLAATCFLRSSQKFHVWLLNNRLCGSYIRNYVEGRGMPLRTRLLTILVLWITIIATMIFWVESLALRIVLIVIASAVSIYVGSRRGKPELT